jgi:glycosyltransferase involved in cell wall biosynthesis
VVEMIEGCNAVCFPGEEDFGIVPVEANAAGKPVVAYAAGGALETLEEGRSAVFFRERTPEAVLEAVRRAQDLDADPASLADGAERFSSASFRENLRAAVERIRRDQEQGTQRLTAS